jgi:deoxyribonucleoside regulator
MPIQNNEITLMVEVARLYYEHRFSQQQIADKLNISRPGVSRLLQKARDEGIVNIEIRDPQQTGTQMESAIKEKYALKQVIVVPSDNDTMVIKQRLGKAAVSLLDGLMKPGIILGVSWGTTMQEVAHQVSGRQLKNVIIVQLNGGVSRAEYNTHASEIAQNIGLRYGAIPYLLPLPAIVDSPAVKDAILSDKNIKRTFDLAKQAPVVMFTIGLFNHDSVLVKADYFDKKQVDDLIGSGAVADICSRIITHDGKICSAALNTRTIGIDLEELRKKSLSIAIAGGKEKLPAIRAGLKSNVFNTLITDEWIAGELIVS